MKFKEILRKIRFDPPVLIIHIRHVIHYTLSRNENINFKSFKYVSQYLEKEAAVKLSHADEPRILDFGSWLLSG